MTGIGAAMAGGNPRRGRQENDFYPTPKEVTYALLNSVSFADCEGIWEPCAGDGAMSKLLVAYTAPSVYASDIAPRDPTIQAQDFFQTSQMPEGFDTIITNPPFDLAERMIRHGFAIGCQRMALVLKSTFWHAAKRSALFEDHRPGLIMPLTWRPDFLGLGAPTMEVMWCYWPTPCSQSTNYRLLRRDA